MSKPKSRYLYVEVRADQNSWRVVNDVVANDEPISFDHVCVEAETLTEAYQLGARAMQEKHATETPTQNTHLKVEFFLNDYAVKL